jgi:signal peptidase II
LTWLIVSAAVVALDQLTKAYMLGALVPYRPHTVIPHVLNWTLVFNRGAAFSFLARDSGWQVWLFGVLALIVSAALAFWLTRIRRRDWRTALPVAMIIGGALGNLIGRLLRGRVTDFIQVYWHTWAWPTFNVADSAITIGAVLLVAFSLFTSGQPRTPAGRALNASTPDQAGDGRVRRHDHAP